MELLLFFLIVGVIAVPPAYGLSRVGFPGTGWGFALCIAIGFTASLFWMLLGLSEEPNNDLGHPRRVHVRNESPDVVYLIRSGDDDPAVLDPVDPGELSIIRGRYHPAYQDLACTDDPMALATVAAGAVRDEAGRRAAHVHDITVVAELDECYPKGHNIVVWDGSTAFVDPDARPPLVDPEDAPLAYGWLAAFTALLMGVGSDLGHRLWHRRRKVADPPAPDSNELVS